MLLDAMKRRSAAETHRANQAHLGTTSSSPTRMARKGPKQAWSEPTLIAPSLNATSSSTSTSMSLVEQIAQVHFGTSPDREESDYDMLSDNDSIHHVSRDDLASLMDTLDQSVFESVIQVQELQEDLDLEIKGGHANVSDLKLVETGLALYANAKAESRRSMHQMQASHALQLALLTSLQAAAKAEADLQSVMAFDAEKYPILMELAKQRLYTIESSSSKLVLVNPAAQSKLLKYWNDHFETETLLAMLEVPGIFESVYNHTIHHVL